MDFRELGRSHGSVAADWLVMVGGRGVWCVALDCRRADDEETKREPSSSVQYPWLCIPSRIFLGMHKDTNGMFVFELQLCVAFYIR